MAGYSSNPLWKKLGYKTDLCVFVDGEPPEYFELLHLPAEINVRWLPKAEPGMDFVHLFCRDAATLGKKLARLRRLIAPGGVIWVSWPKKASGVQTDVSEDVVRNSALAIGLIDIKVCAVDEVWSGLKLMIRRIQR